MSIITGRQRHLIDHAFSLFIEAALILAGACIDVNFSDRRPNALIQIRKAQSRTRLCMYILCVHIPKVKHYLLSYQDFVDPKPERFRVLRPEVTVGYRLKRCSQKRSGEAKKTNCIYS